LAAHLSKHLRRASEDIKSIKEFQGPPGNESSSEDGPGLFSSAYVPS